MPEHLVLVMAKKNDEYIAGALNFKSQDGLFGRYWGAVEEIKHLHFETCYYQGIDYAIAKELSYFDPGVQGEHKIQRGFVPRYTYSYHWIEHAEFRYAIANFLTEERQYLAAYLTECQTMLPFKCGEI